MQVLWRVGGVKCVNILTRDVKEIVYSRFFFSSLSILSILHVTRYYCGRVCFSSHAHQPPCPSRSNFALMECELLSDRDSDYAYQCV